MTEKEIYYAIEYNTIETVCLDDFAGNNNQSPCWVDIYMTANNQYFITANTSFQYDEKSLSKWYYTLEITETQFNDFKDQNMDFNYNFFKTK